MADDERVVGPGDECDPADQQEDIGSVPALHQVVETHRKERNAEDEQRDRKTDRLLWDGTLQVMKQHECTYIDAYTYTYLYILIHMNITDVRAQHPDRQRDARACVLHSSYPCLDELMYIVYVTYLAILRAGLLCRIFPHLVRRLLL